MRRLAMGGCLLAGCLAGALAGFTQGPTESVETPTVPLGQQQVRALFARPLDRAVAPTLGADDLVVLEQGVPQQVVSVEPLDLAQRPWQVVFYLDLPRATPEGLAETTSELARVAEALTAIAEVRIVVAETSLSAGAATRDPQEVVAELRSVSPELAGELIDRRTETRDEVSALAKNDHDARRRLLVEHYFAEEELREWQHAAIEDYLLGSQEGLRDDSPRAVFVLRDGLDASAAEFVRGLSKKGGGKDDPQLERRLRDPETEAERELARTLAALGWHAFPIRFAPRSPLLGELDPDQALASATGGRVLESAADLDLILSEMSQTFAVRYQTQNRSGEPGPIDLRANDAGLRLAAPRWSTGVAPEHLAAVRARSLLEDETAGELSVEAALVGELAGTATLESALRLEDLAAATTSIPLTSEHLRITVVSSRLDRAPSIERFFGAGLELAGERWILRSPIDTPDDLTSVVVVAEDLRTGAWGASQAIEADESLYDGDQATLVESADKLPSAVGGHLNPLATTDAGEDRADQVRRALIGEPRPPRSAIGGADTSTGGERPAILKLVPPRERELSGKQKFQILLSIDSIGKVEFYLDGELVAEDSKQPFEATLDLGPSASERSLKAVALSKTGLNLGEDEITLNLPRSRFGIALTRVEPARDRSDLEAIEATAEVALPRGEQLDRVELYRNQTLAATFTRPPFTARLPGPARRDADFVRAVAYLSDGTSIEDVHLLGEELGDRVEVNLVEIYTVVTDRDGEPVRGLEERDFQVRLGKEAIAIQRFAIADQVPLVLGLAVDTSGSMWQIMPETRKAAARFLADTVSDIDTAFVVDFDDRPRLAHPISGEVFDLIASLSRLQASGATSLYDSILFSLLQFEPGLGRKAVVLLSDGDDYNSKFGFNRVQKMAAESGVPIYFIALGGLDGERPSFRKDDLEVIAEDSGGRVFYVNSMAEVIDAYQRIGDELRSQYVLAFSTERLLTDQEIGKISVEVVGQGNKKLDVRTVIGRD